MSFFFSKIDLSSFGSLTHSSRWELARKGRLGKDFRDRFVSQKVPHDKYLHRDASFGMLVSNKSMFTQVSYIKLTCSNY